MSDSPLGHFNFPDHIKNDTFGGVLITITINSIALDLTTASSINMDLRLPPVTVTSPIVEHYSTTTGDIVIDANPTLGKFTVLKDTIIDVAANTYRYDIEIQFTSGVVKTYVGGNWRILQDVTFV